MYPHQTDAEQLHWAIPAEKITFVEKLREAGYCTAQAGKWHMGDHIMDRFDFLASEKAFRETLQNEETLDLPSSDGSGSHLWIPTFLKLAGKEAGDNFVGEDFNQILADPDKEIREYVFAQEWYFFTF